MNRGIGVGGAGMGVPFFLWNIPIEMNGKRRYTNKTRGSRDWKG